MQHAQTSQSRSALIDRRVLNPLRHQAVPITLNSAAQRTASRRKPVRLRSVKPDLLQLEQTQLRVLADGNTARGGETGSGVFYEAQEEAARRIAQRLHDESAQMLATVYLELAVIARDCPDSTVQKINQVVQQLDEVREQLRGMSHELSPPVLGQLGLMPALQSLAKGVTNRSGLKIGVRGDVTRLPSLVGAVLYRVVQEALSNVVRHAKAKEAWVSLWMENNRVFCSVSDDGIGFKTSGQEGNGAGHGPGQGLGLAGIHERVSALKGRCQIATGPTGGVQVQVEIPL